MHPVQPILVVLLISLIHAGVAHAQWVQTNGLYGGMIVAFAVSGPNLFAATVGAEDHLINNKEYRSKVESAFKERELLARNRKDKLFSVFESGLSLQQEEALKFLFAYMPLSDLADYDGDFFLANVNIALRTRQDSPWGKSIPEDIFLHYVLPCRVGSEYLDSFRMAYCDELQRRVKGMDATEAALEINHWCHEKVTYQPIPGGSGPMSTILSAHGACTAESIVTAAALRTVGIPARWASAMWTHSDGVHTWVEVWIDGKWYHMQGCEPEPVLDSGPAWFTESVERAMGIGTQSFGAKYGQENTAVCYRNYSLVNNLSKYAVTKTITVKVVDANNLPVQGALVEYLFYYHRGPFWPIVEAPTDEVGISRVETGLGDLLVWARKGDDFGFGKICVNDTDRLDLTLNRKPADHGSEELDLAVPVARAPLKAPAPELVAENAKRIHEENMIRQAYIDSWMKPEEAVNLAKELGADPEIVKDLIRRSMGNYKNIASFLTHTPALDRLLAINLLKQVSDKDLRNTKEEIFADHLNNVIRFENTHGYDYELYSKYVLNPSIIGERIVAWRKYLLESLPVEFRQDAINDLSILIKYVKNNIVLDDDETRESHWSIWPQISPKGVDELKVADSFSRDMYFVALCRSLGIPSRVDYRGDDNRLQFYFNKEWHDVWFAERSQPVPGKGFIRFSSDEKDPAPEYFTHFTIARFQDGHYDTFWEKANFQDELAVPAGHYMLVTANRINDSKILATLSFFELKENEHKAIDIKLRRWTRNTTGVGLYIAAWSGDLANVKRLTQEESDVDRKDEWGWTALDWAMRGKQKEVAEFLLAKGANVNIKGEKGLTPLHLAITNNQKELVEMLIAKGADVDAKGKNGGTPLHLAIEHNQKKLAETLIAKGADVNAKDNWNWSLLHAAIYSSKDTAEIKAMVELLIVRGADVNARDGDNRTPLWYAQKEGYTEIVELLRKHGGIE